MRSEPVVVVRQRTLEAVREALWAAHEFMSNHGLAYAFDDEYTQVQDAHNAVWDACYSDPSDPAAMLTALRDKHVCLEHKLELQNIICALKRTIA